ncbi:MAG: hypothetical protein K6C08_14260, partial [Oscillospiraceae bacterium]|nr:hypothetical protein [Oscillospiraceae bacterium]
MKSGKFFFNRGISQSLLRRFWPLWLGVLAMLILLGPAQVSRLMSYMPEYPVWRSNEMVRGILGAGVDAARFEMAAAVLTAMAMYSYLYLPRTCGLMNTVPVRRETVFLTAFLTGLLPLLAADLIAFLCLLGAAAGVEGVSTAVCLQWLKAVVLSTVGFYGLASFCAVLTGNILVLPVVYLVLGVVAAAAEGCVRALLGSLVYGYTYNRFSLTALSPLVYVLDNVQVTAPGTSRDPSMEIIHYQIGHLGYLGWFCLAGLVLTVLAVLLLRRRHMESVGDVVAVPQLRPVFRCCMAAGCAIALAVLLEDFFYGRTAGGRNGAVVVFPALVAGSLIGWFGSEMLMKKTLRVFHSGWKGYGIITACLLLFAVCAETDLTGYEKRVPAAEEIDNVRLLSCQTPLRDGETMELCRALHRQIIGHKSENERADQTMEIHLRYELKNGKAMDRLYYVKSYEGITDEPESDLSTYERLINCPEVRMTRFDTDGISAADIRWAQVTQSFLNEAGWLENRELHLTREQAEDLYNTAILPDGRDGKIGYSWMSYGEASRRALTTLNVYF